jgi:hypothetical protein
MYTPTKHKGPALLRRTPELVRLETTRPGQSVARARVAATDRHCRNARAADRLMPLAVHYGPRPLVPVGLAEYLGRWAS